MALSNYLNLAYEKVEAVAKAKVRDYDEGLNEVELKRVARALGFPLVDVISKGFSSIDVVAIVGIDIKGKRKGHWALVNRGLVIDNGVAMPWDLYLHELNGTIVSVYVLRS